MADPVYGPSNPDPETIARQSVKRYGSVIELRPESEAYYRELHANAWSGNLRQMHQSNLRNFTIFLGEVDGRRLLFSFFEYIGTDFEADMAAIAANPETQRWWAETDPCQRRLPDTPDGEQWLPLEMVFQQPVAP